VEQLAVELPLVRLTNVTLAVIAGLVFSLALGMRQALALVGRRFVVLGYGLYAKPLFVHAPDSVIKMRACQMGIAFGHLGGFVAQYFADGQ
jgi:hypothetical protein